ncbi:hypothetical protein LOTGIDRAFT_238607 [Lottia gigantea]|uniref:DUF19 domain-containing protein n=1 Tax=Lottia gigantea TaxID=225164 RepID=V4AYS4_LOTGI|nr:hypothetical protein LOTGIDRAFT_238607 [Lottia gigantea]ESP00326.1 hypothetical protein LOTGIDRAFT_238607 [Lottia gigantea]
MIIMEVGHILTVGLCIIPSLLLGLSSAKQCEHTSVTECYDPVLNATNTILNQDRSSSSGIKVENIWTICRYYYTAEGCLHERLKGCKRSNQINRDKVALYRDYVVRKGIVGLCDKPDIIQAYGIYSDCIYDNWNDIEVCLENIAGRLNNALIKHPDDLDHSISSRYCSFVQDILKCSYNHMAAVCGHESGQVMRYLVRDYLPIKAVQTCVDETLHAPFGYDDVSSGGDDALFLGLTALVVGGLMLFISMAVM